MPLTANDVPATENKVEMTNTVQESPEVQEKVAEEKIEVVDENGNLNEAKLDLEKTTEDKPIEVDNKSDENVICPDATSKTETEACVIGDNEQLQQNEMPAEKKAEKIDCVEDMCESTGKDHHLPEQEKMEDGSWEHVEHEEKVDVSEKQEVHLKDVLETAEGHVEKTEAVEEHHETKAVEEQKPADLHATEEKTNVSEHKTQEHVDQKPEPAVEAPVEEPVTSELEKHEDAADEPICEEKKLSVQEGSAPKVQETPDETSPRSSDAPTEAISSTHEAESKETEIVDVSAVEASVEANPLQEEASSPTPAKEAETVESENHTTDISASVESPPSQEETTSPTPTQAEIPIPETVESENLPSEATTVTSDAQTSSPSENASCEDGIEQNKKDIASEKVAVADIDAPTAESAANPATAATEAPAVPPTVEAPAIVISPAQETEEAVNRPEALSEVKMSEPSTPVVRTPAPIAPPRRPSSAVFTGTLRRSPASTRSSGKLFNTLPRSTLSSTKEEVGPKKKKGMFSWLGGDSSKKKNKEVLETVSDGLRKIYKQKLYPLEEFYKFHDFHSPALDDPDFDAKPMILLVGQYSTGKTTFIRYLLEQDFPGIRIGPEPTTDRFIAVMHGDEEGVIPGNALVVDAKKQFRALSGFGNAFLNRFQCSSLPNQVLESVTIVDTPGILSGEKQRIDRGYDFTGVLEWFAERVDRIILLFDAHKLDISDEFKRCIEALAGNEDKIRIVLNKSDMVDHQQLMRVYGALMWSLGKVFRTPEVSRVYLGSFWDHPLHYDINRRLFQDEQHDLFQDLQALPRNAALRKLNDLIKRARLAKVHAYIISELRKQMPSMIGKEKKKKELIQNLDKIFEQIQREHNISPGDFPDINKMREKLQNQDFTKFNALKPKLLEVVDGMLASDIARLMAQIPKEEQTVQNGNHDLPTVKGGAFSQAQEAETPFGFGRGEGFDKGADEVGWVVNRERSSADSTFESLGPVGGFVSGRAAKEHMVKSKLPNAVLGKIWKLADVDQDGQLDADEFALANYLINLKLEGHELPSELPGHLVPPSKRDAETVYPALDEE